MRPDFGFENYDESGPNCPEHSPDARDIIEWAIENSVDQRRRFSHCGFASGDSRGRQIDRSERLVGSKLLDERYGGGDLSGRYCMQPDGSCVRPSEQLGQHAEALAEMGPVFAL